MTLLAISFNSLSWRETANCQRAATQICWPLLRQVPKIALRIAKCVPYSLHLNVKPCSFHFLYSVAQVVGGNLLPEAVTWLYVSVLKALQMHGQHDGCSAALFQLALLLYDALVGLAFLTTGL